MQEELKQQLKKYIEVRKQYDESHGKPNRFLIKDQYSKIAESLWFQFEEPIELDGLVITKGYIKTRKGVTHYLNLYTPESFKRMMDYRSTH
jgi:hypothetical protein